jgi:hypothetical protein
MVRQDRDVLARATNQKSQFSPRSVGHVHKRLGFKKRIMPDSKKGILLDEKVLSRLCYRYKIRYPLENERNVGNVGSNIKKQVEIDVFNVFDLHFQNISMLTGLPQDLPRLPKR